MPYKDVGMRKKVAREGMKKLRGLVTMGDVNPDYVNPCDEESEPRCEPLGRVYPNYDMHPKHKDGCACMLCEPERWPDLKVDFKELNKVAEEGKELVKEWTGYPNYDIHPAHAENCDCMCCSGGVKGKDGKFRLMKELLAGV